MLLGTFLWTVVFTTTEAITTLQTSHPVTHPPHSLLARLERLEHLLTDQQTQLNYERDEWRKEKRDMRAQIEALQNDKQTSREAVRVLQEDVHALQREKQDMRAEIQALQDAHTLTQTVAGENQDLKSQLGHVQRQMVSMDMQVTSLRHQVAQCGDNTVSPDTVGGQDAGDQHSPQEQSARASTISARQGMVLHGDGPTPQHQSHSRPNPHLSDLDPEQQHMQSARSDDQGPLQVVVDHLAATTTQLTSDLQVLKTQVTAVQAAQGSTFVQWGSSTCSGSSDLVYTGVVGGSYFTHTGAAANTLCLSMSPTLVDKSVTAFALLYGGEYHTEDFQYKSDPVCSVCRSHHSSTVMVPGTNVCASGWSLMYSGYLLAGWTGHAAASEYICVDSKMEASTHSTTEELGYLLYYTKTQCGTLPCPPYENNKFVTCAVCSK